jgi:hypothetical protein
MTRFLRFRLWHAFVLITAIAVGLGCVAALRRQAARESAALHEIHMLGGAYELYVDQSVGGRMKTFLRGEPAIKCISVRLSDLDDPYESWGPYGPGGKGVRIRDWTPENIERLAPHLQQLPQITQLSFRASPLPPGILGQLVNGLDRLTYLGLANTNVPAADIAALEHHVSLTRLDLSDTEVTDEALAHLAGLTELELLRLEDTRITDAGLAHLAELRKLQEVDLGLTLVSPESIPLLAKWQISEQVLVPAEWPHEAVEELRGQLSATCEVRHTMLRFADRPNARALKEAPPLRTSE